MHVEKVLKNEAIEKKSVVKFYYKYRGKPMVCINGNFKGGEFFISKNKVKAIIDNIQELQEFALGNYDDKILRLLDDEILKP